MDCKLEVIRYAKKLYERQMVNANEGNVSLRDGERIYITPSSVCKELLTPEMIVVCDRQGNQLEGEGRPSSELLLHLYVYDHRPDVNGVVHCHSPYATAYAIARKPIETRAYTEMIFLYDRIPVVDYGAPSTPDIVRGMGRYLEQTDILLLANHGMVSVGDTVMDAYLKAEAGESLAKTLTLAKLLGGEHPLEPEELDKLYAMRREKLGKGPVVS